MKLIYIQTLNIGKKIEIPFRITVGCNIDFDPLNSFLIRPEITIPKRIYELHQLERMLLLYAPPFCDIADELIELFQDNLLVFSERKQFLILKSQFKTIGYNFNVNPKILWHSTAVKEGKSLEDVFQNPGHLNIYGEKFAHFFVETMQDIVNETSKNNLDLNQPIIKKNHPDLSKYKSTPGVYFLLDQFDEVLYVGKAKNVRKRLQSHFSSSENNSNIDYSKVSNINVEYTGNDIVAQLLESESIKSLRPIFNTQQISNSDPFIINRGKTAKGIHRLKITRKDIQDNMPEKHFNRQSVKQSLEDFCSTNHLCRKHCGLESMKGPCSNYTLLHRDCVCAGNESIAFYNDRFDDAFKNFLKRKTRKVYKLKGRSSDEDAFIYTVNGIFEGYGFIDKSDIILTENDILGHLISMSSNYDTSRIISDLPKHVLKEHILTLE